MPERPTVAEMAGSFSGPDSVEWLRAQRCTTHHEACDCIHYRRAQRLREVDAAMAQATDDAVRMAREVLTEHVGDSGDMHRRERCRVCGDFWICPTAVAAQAVIERWTDA